MAILKHAAHRAKLSSISTLWKDSTCATSGTLVNGPFGSQADRQGPWASCSLVYSHSEMQTVLALICATAQQSYCRNAGVRRPSVCRPSIRKTRSQNSSCRLMPNLVYLFSISPDHFLFVCFSKFCIFDFLRIFFVFVNMGAHGRKNFKRHLL